LYFVVVLFVFQVGEVGELSEIFQWKGEVPRGLPDWKGEEKEHLGEELSDVLLYLVRLSDVCGVDLGKAAMRKLEINAIKYPVQLCKGSSEKKRPINAGNNATGDGVTGSIYSNSSTSNSNGV
jgi:dCTP diphosphatase